MNPVLVPRLQRPQAFVLVQDIAGESLEALQNTTRLMSGVETFAGTGGARISEAMLGEFRRKLTGIAIRAGYPSQNAQGHRKFDVLATAWLSDNWPGTLSEALRPDTWTYVSTVLLPHLTKWRYPSMNLERFSGPLPRVSMGRLWLIGHLLDRGRHLPAGQRWAIVRDASEDFKVSLIERPGLSADRRLSLAIGEAWLQMRNQLAAIPGSDLERLSRDAMKRLSLSTAIVESGILTDDAVHKLVSDAYREALAATG